MDYNKTIILKRAIITEVRTMQDQVNYCTIKNLGQNRIDSVKQIAKDAITELLKTAVAEFASILPTAQADGSVLKSAGNTNVEPKPRVSSYTLKQAAFMLFPDEMTVTTTRGMDIPFAVSRAIVANGITYSTITIMLFSDILDIPLSAGYLDPAGSLTV